MITRTVIRLEEFLSKPEPTCGATAFFAGIVRNHHEGRRVQKLFYDCYEPMASPLLQQIAGDIKRQTGVDCLRVLHRIGWLEIGDIAVVIEAHAFHRDEAFKACRAMIETIKREVPIWKKEIYDDGSMQWVRCAHAGTEHHDTVA